MNVIDRPTRLRWRRRFRRSRKQVEEMGVQAEERLERHFFKRLSRLIDVRRFVAGWVLLMVLLAGIVGLQLRGLGKYYQELKPVPGGTYSEGMAGSFTNANPLYATGLVDTSVSKLIFAGLLKYDSNNHLIGDLAQSWKVSEDGKVYTFVLKPHLTWQDGQALTADDVVFTFQTARNPDAKSPLFHAWQDVTIKAVDARTITFSLPNPLAPFIYGLTAGIIPKHSLEAVPIAQLRSSTFNTAHPIGAGPFKWETIEIVAGNNDINEQHIGLRAFDGYHGGAPALQQFVIKTYPDENQLIASFQKQEINAMVGLNSMPDALAHKADIQEYSLPLTAETMVFFKTDSEPLKDVRVRQALVQAVSVPTLVNGLGYPVIPADEPLLHGQLGYNPSLKQFSTNLDQANKLLEDAGWKRTAGSAIRSNGTGKLSIKLVAQNNLEYVYLTQQLQKAWQAIGVDVQVTLPNDTDLQSTITGRGYDALLFGISVGVDPDVFAYWHSSQADPRASSRLNLSDYKSLTADKALEGGRTRLDAGLRIAKYAPFLQSWRTDAPALALYQPRFLYITRG
ncbi:MAG TPA: peptide ABC transporter substrate-binding protein, partial [Candidatus Saccharimonadales bacterium]|nr:peptide ABC transporter substrate-binding protein [Candidatus Saccharimonadales bacterium]